MAWGLVPAQGTEILQATWHGHKKQTRKPQHTKTKKKTTYQANWLQTHFKVLLQTRL